MDISFVIENGGYSNINDFPNNRTFMTPSGQPFTLPNNVNTLGFITVRPELGIPDGALVRFIKNGIQYKAIYSARTFIGYSSTNKKDGVISDIGSNYKTGDQIILGYRSGQQCNLNVKIGALKSDFKDSDLERKGGIGELIAFSNIVDYKTYEDPILCLKEYGQQIYRQILEEIDQNDPKALIELSKIAKLADELGEEYFQGFVDGKDGSVDFYSMYKRQIYEFTTQELTDIVIDLAKYKSAIQIFNSKSTDDSFSKQEILNLVNNYFVFGIDFKYCFRSPFLKLNSKQRINLINKLSIGIVSGRINVAESWWEEDIILELLETTPSLKQAHKDILDELESKKILPLLIKDVDGANFTKLTEILVSWIFDVYPCPTDFSLTQTVIEKKYLVFNNSFLIHNLAEISSNGDISINVLSPLGSPISSLKTKPFDYINVKFESDFKDGASSFLSKHTYKLPAIFVLLLFNQDGRNKLATTGKLIIDVALLTIGAKEIKVMLEAKNWIAVVGAVADLGIGFTDIAINDVFQTEVKNNYPTFYENWEKINLVYGIGRLAQVGLEALIKKTIQDCKTMKVATNLSPESKKVVSAIETKLEGELLILEKSNQNINEISSLLEKNNLDSQFADELAAVAEKNPTMTKEQIVSKYGYFTASTPIETAT